MKKRIRFLYLFEGLLILVTITMIFLLVGCAKENRNADGPTSVLNGEKIQVESADQRKETQVPEDRIPKEETAGEETLPKEEISKTDEISESSFDPTNLSDDELIALINERQAYYVESAYYSEMLSYWEEVRGVTDISYKMYPLYETDKKYLTKEELEDEPSTVIHLAKNEIYARHGYIFQDKDLYNYFMGCIWYTPTTAPEDFDEGILNKYEKANLELLAELEGKNQTKENTEKTYYGHWKIVDFIAPGITALSTDEMEGYINVQLTYAEESFIVDDVSLDNPIYNETIVTKEDFADGYNNQVTFDSLNVSSASVMDVSITNSSAFGSMFLAADENTLYITLDGAFFKAVRQSE